MRPTKYRKPCGGFDNQIKTAVFLFQRENTEGVINAPIFKDMAVSRRYHHVLNSCSAP